MTSRPWLHSSDGVLAETYDAALLDLDGVVYVGPRAVPGAPGHLSAARARGMALAYVTNNAARPPAVVAEHLVALGLDAREEDVVTSAQAAARMLARRLPATSRVFVIGGLGLEEALRERGLEPVQDAGAEPVAVVSGYHPDLRWRTVIDGAILVRSGLPWVATNTDLTVPTPQGAGPGNGVLVRAVADFAGRQPDVAGKPEPPLFAETVERVGASRPLVVGDRLDTDIEGASRSGADSLLVLTGVTGLEELVAATPPQRPTYLAADLGGLLTAHPGVSATGQGSVHHGGWRVEVRSDDLAVSGDGAAADWWRAVAAAAWGHADDTGRTAGTTGLAPPRG